MISFGQLAALSKPSRTVAGFAAGSLLHTPWPVLVVLAVMAVCVEALRTIPQLLSTITPQRSGDRRESLDSVVEACRPRLSHRIPRPHGR